MRNIPGRTSSAVITVKNPDGSPAAGAEVRLSLIKNEFLFGCGAFETMPYVNGIQKGRRYGSVSDSEAENAHARLEDRMNKWLKLFNFGTLPFYWGNYEREEGKPLTAETLRAAGFLKEKGVTLKGHPLCWHTSCANWLMNYDTDTILDMQLARIEREVTAFKGVIDMWDVINEVVIMPVYDKYDNAVTRICKKLGRVGLVKKVFDAAHAANPDATLLINDFNLSQSYEILIDGCLNAGAPISTIGLQTHQHHGAWTADKFEETLSRFEYFGLPIHFTENTIVAGPNVPAHIIDLQDAHYNDEDTSPEYEQMQAEKLEAMYRLLYEKHPLVTAISNWDFGDGAWLNAPSGVIRKDGSLKPSYERLYRLIHGEYSTDVTIKADENGRVTLEGTKGLYAVSANGAAAEYTLKDGEDAGEVTLG